MTSVSALPAMVSRGTIEVVWCFREREASVVAGGLLSEFVPEPGGPQPNLGRVLTSGFLRSDGEDLLVIDLQQPFIDNQSFGLKLVH